jgi:uncharacterized protein
MIGEPVVVDTGPLIALYNSSDPYHLACVDQVRSLPLGKAYTCWPVIVEAAYLLRHYPRDRKRLFDALVAGEFVLLTLDTSDLRGIQATLDGYQDQDVDFADAALLHLANREAIDSVFTLDRRHFNVYRRSGGKPFRLFPEVLKQM